MSEGKMREEFEAWHRSKFATKYCTGQPTRDMHNGVYADEYGPQHEQERWEIWQASRTALEIEMPAVEAWINDGRLDREKDEDADECIGLAPLCDVRAAIEAVGVGVK